MAGHFLSFCSDEKSIQPPSQTLVQLGWLAVFLSIPSSEVMCLYNNCSVDASVFAVGFSLLDT